MDFNREVFLIWISGRIVIWIVYAGLGREIDEGEHFKKGVFRSWRESLGVFIEESLIRDIRSQGNNALDDGVSMESKN